jgi:hypothetical protein
MAPGARGRSPEMRETRPAAPIPDERPPAVGIQDRGQRAGERDEVAVVDPPVVHLAGELAEQLWPVVARRCQCHADLDASLDDLHRSAAGRCCPRLLPRAVPARRRTPLGDRATASWRDRFAAPGAVGGRGSSLGSVPRGLRRVRGLRLRCRLSPLTPLSLALTSSCPVLRGVLAAPAARLLASLQLLVTTSS